MLNKTESCKKSYIYLAAAILMSLVTLIAYIPALKNGFVNWDDPKYVYENSGIQTLDLHSISDKATSLWHPLTMLSLALDHAVWGLNPFGYHLTNIFLHSLNAALVFILVINLAGIAGYEKSKAMATGIITAMLFGIHPLHVESVAWVSERKNVLSAFFSLFSLLAYINNTTTTGSKRLTLYIVCLASFAMALISKATAVSLPVTFLILDAYPLNRLQNWKNLKLVLAEKIPFILLAGITSFITLGAVRSGGGLVNTETYPIMVRIFVAMKSYIFYLIKMLLPFNLAPFYYHPRRINAFSIEYLMPALLLLVITISFILLFKKNRLFLALWTYYTVSLIPVIGIVQAGGQAAADRYTYLPCLGPFILVGVSCAILLSICSRRQRQAFIMSLVILSVILMTNTLKQISIWHDTISLWSHEIRIFPNTDLAYFSRGAAYGELGDYRQALKDLTKCIEVNSRYADAFYNRGTIYYSLDNYRLAIKDFNAAIDLQTGYYEKAYNNRAIAYYAIGNFSMAIEDSTKAILLDPRDGFAYNNRGNAYYGLGNYRQALEDYSKAIELNPRYADAFNNRGYIYYLLGNSQQALNDLKKTIALNPKDGDGYYKLAAVYSKLGNRDLALDNYKKAARLGFKEAEDYLSKQGID